MRSKVVNKCELLAENRNIISKIFAWDSEYMAVAAAAIMASEGVLADVNKLKQCSQILKDNTGWFSALRGNSKVPLIAKMAISPDPKAYIKKVMEIYDYMVKTKLKGGEYRVMAAIVLADNVDSIYIDRYIARTDEIYKRMAKAHSILTSGEDIPFASMLAISDQDVNHMIDDMEKSYSLLKKNFFSKNPVQSLTHVLTLSSDSPEVKCDKVIRLFDELKNSRHQFGTGFELCILGTAALTDMSVDSLVDLISEADDVLASKRGFGGLTFGKAERRLIATQMVMSVCTRNTVACENAALSSMLAAAIAMEMCMLVIAISAAESANIAATTANF